MRIVLEGTPTTPRRLRARDLPADRDLSRSFWRYVNASGFNLSTYNMTDIDIFDSNCSNVILPAQIDWMQSRRNVWTGATIPASLSSYIQDLIREVMVQALPRLSGVPLQVAQIGIAMITASYANSWTNILWTVRDQLGLSDADLFTHTADVMAGYPRLLARLRYHVSSGHLSPDPMRPPDLSQMVVRLVGAVSAREDLRSFSFTRQDRFQLEQSLVNLVLQRRGIQVDVRVGQVDPFPVVFMREDPQGDWREKAWPA